MANYLTMAVLEMIIALRRRGWLQRRIAPKLGIAGRRWRVTWQKVKTSKSQPAHDWE